MSDLESLQSISLKVKNTRKSVGVSQKKLANFTGISQSTIARLETDIERMNPSYSLLYRVFDSLDELGRSGGDSEIMGKRAYELMHKKIIFAKKTQSIKNTIDIMKANDFSQMPVLNDDMSVAGTIYQKKLLDAATQYPNQIQKMKISEIIDPSLPQIAKDTPVSKLKPILESWDAVLVVDKGKAIGIITIYDIFKIL